jgi:small GTP-binding protein
MVKPITVVKKICLFGDRRVGKTSLIKRYVEGDFIEEYVPSIGTKVSRKNVLIKDPSGQTQPLNVNLLIWDVLGQKEHGILHKPFYAGAEGGIIVCDGKSPASLANATGWIKGFRSAVGNVPIILVINKVDLGEIAIDENRIRTFCMKNNVSRIMTSAKSGENVETLFYTMSENVIEVRPF